MATRVYDEDPNTLPPLTKAISLAYGPRSNGNNRGSYGGPFDPIENPAALSAVIDAIRSLEQRVIDLETP